MKLTELFENYIAKKDSRGINVPIKGQKTKEQHQAAADWHNKEHETYSNYKGADEANKTYASARADKHKRLADYHTKKARSAK